MFNNHFDVEEFEKEWVQLAREICQVIYTQPQIQAIKNSLQKNGFLALEEKSQFIDTCDKVKYEVIFKKYGKDGSEGYSRFSAQWKDWFQQKGVESQRERGQRNSVDHIMFGSTPDPARFLLHFEEEMLGSMSTK